MTNVIHLESICRLRRSPDAPSPLRLTVARNASKRLRWEVKQNGDVVAAFILKADAKNFANLTNANIDSTQSK